MILQIFFEYSSIIILSIHTNFQSVAEVVGFPCLVVELVLIPANRLPGVGVEERAEERTEVEEAAVERPAGRADATPGERFEEEADTRTDRWSDEEDERVDETSDVVEERQAVEVEENTVGVKRWNCSVEEQEVAESTVEVRSGNCSFGEREGDSSHCRPVPELLTERLGSSHLPPSFSFVVAVLPISGDRLVVDWVVALDP